MEKLESGLYRVKYKPTLVGNHLVTILQRKQPISKQPWNVQVFDPSRVKLFDMSDAFCDQPASFKGKNNCNNIKNDNTSLIYVLWFVSRI